MIRIGVQVNTITYSAAISACEKGAEWDIALDMLKTMGDVGVQVSTIICSAAVSACEKGAERGSYWQP